MLSFPPASSKALEAGGNTAPAWHLFPALPAVPGAQEQHRRAVTSPPWVSWYSNEGSAASERLQLTHFLGKVVLALGNNWHCSFLQGGMHRAGFWLDSPCWAVESLTFSSITPCLCLLGLFKQLTGAGIPISSYMQWWLQIESQSNLRIHPIPNPAEA